ncbi:metalloregulator ArsR/SmtB family transcription factor [Pseudomonas sp. GX19020]|uniref:ArsR/SmtB family transcription factor n=1 Tax=Pseudomonas sp. GX19020 TaxID=2942277 RepID=UPI0020190333|nr:metalloregulator ArsR/SmtB family transcription factor [Pseudomonas sp. GX19020]MCL4068031.1 metalloregulator ArsR/SmtB family transcription factor [Pseudomonas sp. GX19020]
MLKTIANPNRLAIVCHLMEADRSVAQLEEDLGISQPTLSQQLTWLRNAGVIQGRRDARNVVYGIDDRRIRALVHTLRMLFTDLEDLTMQKRRAVQAAAHEAGQISDPIDEAMFD